MHSFRGFAIISIVHLLVPEQDQPNMHKNFKIFGFVHMRVKWIGIDLNDSLE